MRAIGVNVHVPSTAFNRDEARADGHNVGRMEHDTLHDVSAAVQALQSAVPNPELARMHVAQARKRLDQIEAYIDHLARALGA